jgi:hypothetical protein
MAVAKSDCEGEDWREIVKLILGTSERDMSDFNTKPWSEAIFITSGHSVRSQWNLASLQNHAASTGHRVYVSQVEGVQVDAGGPITIVKHELKQNKGTYTARKRENPTQQKPCLPPNLVRAYAQDELEQ